MAAHESRLHPPLPPPRIDNAKGVDVLSHRGDLQYADAVEGSTIAAGIDAAPFVNDNV